MRLIDADWVLAALGVFNDRKHGDAHFFNGIASAEEIVEHAPTIAPRDWTPCTEGLPKKVDFRLWSKNVLATIEVKTGERYVIEAYYHYGHNEWKHDQEEDLEGEVIAWQNRPDPYNPDHIRDTTKKVED